MLLLVNSSAMNVSKDSTPTLAEIVNVVTYLKQQNLFPDQPQSPPPPTQSPTAQPPPAPRKKKSKKAKIKPQKSCRTKKKKG